MKRELKILFTIIICVIAVTFISIAHKNQTKPSEENQQVESINKEESLEEIKEEETEVKEEQKEDVKNEEQNKKQETIKNEVVKPNVQQQQQQQNTQDVIIGSLDFGSDDALMLHKISIAEAGNQSVESMALIMLVVLNRTWSDTFPDSIYEVIHQRNQFTPVSNGSYDRAQPNEKSAKAMELVLSGWNESQGALYFETCKGESWHSKNLQLLFEKEGTRYYK